MRLLNTDDLTFKDWNDEDDIPPYVAVSHRWSDNEVSLHDVERGQPDVPSPSWRKLLSVCQRAKGHMYDYLWMDTCCIDQRSSAELSEAINSMYNWYRDAAICYVYLEDVEDPCEEYPYPELAITDRISNSTWFSRGWTLQELVAPRRLTFFSRSWTELGGRCELSQVIERTTGISQEILNQTVSVAETNVFTKVSWVKQRMTRRVEDMAYSLLAIFNVNMLPIYGEGLEALYRLQKKIIKTVWPHTLGSKASEAVDYLRVCFRKEQLLEPSMCKGAQASLVWSIFASVVASWNEYGQVKALGAPWSWYQGGQGQLFVPGPRSIISPPRQDGLEPDHFKCCKTCCRQQMKCPSTMQVPPAPVDILGQPLPTDAAWIPHQASVAYTKCRPDSISETDISRDLAYSSNSSVLRLSLNPNTPSPNSTSISVDTPSRASDDALSVPLLPPQDLADTFVQQDSPIPLSQTAHITPAVAQRKEAKRDAELYACTECNTRFLYRKDLARHQNGRHAVLPNHICKICSKSFRRPSALHRHMQVCHCPAPHICTLCNNYFSREDTLRRHIEHKHGMASQLFSCSRCDYVTSRKDSLLAHDRRKHEDQLSFRYRAQPPNIEYNDVSQPESMLTPILSWPEPECSSSIDTDPAQVWQMLSFQEPMLSPMISSATGGFLGRENDTIVQGSWELSTLLPSNAEGFLDLNLL